MIIHRVTLPALALGFLLAASASGQHPHAMGAMGGKVEYDPEPRGGDPNAPVGCAGVEAKIRINDMSFSPATITVDPGQPVCWTWSGNLEHTVKADNDAFSTGNPSDKGNFQFVFTAPGTYGYYCQVHGTLTGGMRGKIIVRGAPTTGGEGPGAIGFAASTYDVSEGAGAVSVIVERAGGSEGVATVKFAVSAGSAKGGKDYVARSGTLRWEDGDPSPKSIDVAIKNDTAKESDESFSVKLSKVTRSAMGSSTATVTIHDDDSAGCGASLAAASQVRAAGQSDSEIRLTWADASTEAKSVRIERRQAGGEFREIVAVAAGAESFLDSGLPGGTDFQYRLRTEALDGSSALSGIAAGATDGLTTPCDDSGKSLCLNGGRFEATVQAGRDIKRVTLPEAGSSGLFSLSPDQDLQLLLNVHDGCAANGHYWLDLAAVTAAEFTVKVRDTQTGHTWVYFHQPGSAPAPLRDVEAFAACP